MIKEQNISPPLFPEALDLITILRTYFQDSPPSKRLWWPTHSIKVWNEVVVHIHVPAVFLFLYTPVG